MTETKLIDGKAFADKLKARVAGAVEKLKTKYHITPGLAVVLVGEDPASVVYVTSKAKQSREAGMMSSEIRLPEETSEHALLEEVERLNHDPSVHGILVQMPLPKQINSQRIIAAIDPEKDVDGLHPVNAGRLMAGIKGPVPCTPLGCLMLIKDQRADLVGLDAIVIGRSVLVGKPMANLLINESCTVTIAHSKTRDLAKKAAQADILVAAVGRAGMVKGDWIKPGAIVIDVGVNVLPSSDGKRHLAGDVVRAEAMGRASAITPVPGGVGPMTIACLFYNTVHAACARANVDPAEVGL